MSSIKIFEDDDIFFKCKREVSRNFYIYCLEEKSFTFKKDAKYTIIIRNRNIGLKMRLSSDYYDDIHKFLEKLIDEDILFDEEVE